jgi:hypothetical protein
VWKNGKKEQATICKNITQKIKDRATRTPLKIGGESRCSGRVGMLGPIISKKSLCGC